MRIIVFGIAGVGKTTACKQYVSRHPDYVHLIASTLIREATGMSLAQLRAASAEQLMANQSILHDAVEQKLSEIRVSNFILDGQCVLDNGKALVVLDTADIAPFRPSGLLLLEAPPREIERRRLGDSRVRPLRTESEIKEQLLLNREAVRSYAEGLGIPFVVAEAEGPMSLERPMVELSHSL